MGLEAQRGAHALDGAVVDVGVDAAVGLVRGDPAGRLLVPGGDAHRRIIAHRRIHVGLGVTAAAAIVDAVEIGFDGGAECVVIGLVGDVTNRTRQRAGTVQGALRPAQHLDAVHVEQVDVRREQRQRDHRFVQVDADLLLDAGLVAHDLAGRGAADGDLALAGAEILHRKRGHGAGYVLQADDAAFAHLLFGAGGNRKRNVLQGLRAFARRHRDFLEDHLAVVRLLGQQRGYGYGQGAGDRQHQVLTIHVLSFRCAE